MQGVFIWFRQPAEPVTLDNLAAWLEQRDDLYVIRRDRTVGAVTIERLRVGAIGDFLITLNTRDSVAEEARETAPGRAPEIAAVLEQANARLEITDANDYREAVADGRDDFWSPDDGEFDPADPEPRALLDEIARRVDGVGASYGGMGVLAGVRGHAGGS